MFKMNLTLTIILIINRFRSSGKMGKWFLHLF